MSGRRSSAVPGWRMRRAAAAALLLAAGEARGYERTTTSSGLCLYWASRRVPYAVNDFSVYGALEVCGAPVSSAVFTSVEQGFTAWTQARLSGEPSPCTDLQLDPAPTPSTSAGRDGTNLVVFRRGPCGAVVPSGDPCLATRTCADKWNCWDTSDPQHADARIIALTSVFYDTRTGAILDSDMELNAWDGTLPQQSGFYFTCVDPGPGVGTCSSAGQPDCIDIDVQNVVTHEAGHFIGLAHNCETGQVCPASGPEATMYATAPAGETKKRTLEQDDVQGICAIYPLGQPVRTCGTLEGDGCGCGLAGAEGWLGLAALLLLRRRTRR